jgi:hypothetical protein
MQAKPQLQIVPYREERGRAGNKELVGWTEHAFSWLATQLLDVANTGSEGYPPMKAAANICNIANANFSVNNNL